MLRTRHGDWAYRRSPDSHDHRRTRRFARRRKFSKRCKRVTNASGEQGKKSLFFEAARSSVCVRCFAPGAMRRKLCAPACGHPHAAALFDIVKSSSRRTIASVRHVRTAFFERVRLRGMQKLRIAGGGSGTSRISPGCAARLFAEATRRDARGPGVSRS